ncbi:MAG: NHL repeat-containing protein, partial [Nitrospira sp.]|nr:NHL repeat-containing protein [Nitrospira sp.]
FSILIPPDISFALTCINTKFVFDVEPGANQPSDMSIAPNGDIYLVDGVNNRIIVLSKSGRWKFDFGKEGTGSGQFKYPLGIDISDDGKVFIADSGNHRIQVFNLNGKYAYKFDVESESGEHGSDPVDIIASNIKDYLYVADNENHNIKVYNRKGEIQFRWGKFGEELGEFRYPGIMTSNGFNEILVVDVLNTRAQKFNPFGKFISSIGSWGVLQGSFFRPKGVAVDKNNRVFVSDGYMGVLQAFTDMGSFLGVVCKNNKKRVFDYPAGIYIDKDNLLYVVEMKGNRITVLKIID